LIAQFTTAPALDDTEFNFSAILGGTGPLEEFSKNGVPADENGNMLNSQITKSGNMFVGGDQLDDITSAMESEEGEPEQHEARADNRVSSVALELEEIQNIDTAVSGKKLAWPTYRIGVRTDQCSCPQKPTSSAFRHTACNYHATGIRQPQTKHTISQLSIQDANVLAWCHDSWKACQLKRPRHVPKA
jgi:hypothetical protein